MVFPNEKKFVNKYLDEIGMFGLVGSILIVSGSIGYAIIKIAGSQVATVHYDDVAVIFYTVTKHGFQQGWQAPLTT